MCTFQHLDFIVQINLLKSYAPGTRSRNFEPTWKFLVYCFGASFCSNLCGIELHLIRLYKKTSTRKRVRCARFLRTSTCRLQVFFTSFLSVYQGYMGCETFTMHGGRPGLLLICHGRGYWSITVVQFLLIEYSEYRNTISVYHVTGRRFLLFAWKCLCWRREICCMK